MTEDSVLSAQLVVGNKVMEMYFELAQNNKLESIEQDLTITGEDFIFELRKV